MKQLFFLLTLFNVGFCYGQNYSLNDFEESPIPKSGSQEWHSLNNATDREFTFSFDSGLLKISKAVYSSHVEYILKNGKLIGVDMGEFGGGLYYKPNDTLQNRIFVNEVDGKNIQPRWFGGLMVPRSNRIQEVLKNSFLLQSGNIKFIFSFNDSVYSMGGLAHMRFKGGYIFKIRNKGDSFYISHILNLDDAPAAMSIHDDHIYVATSGGFFILDKKLNKKVIFNTIFWEGLYPTSVVVIDDKNIYVTFRGGYAKINSLNKEIHFYKAK
ncbi:MAG: hypothetical protein ABI374_04585 [Ginsengibacter sp.]